MMIGVVEGAKDVASTAPETKDTSSSILAGTVTRLCRWECG